MRLMAASGSVGVQPGGDWRTAAPSPGSSQPTDDAFLTRARLCLSPVRRTARRPSRLAADGELRHAGTVTAKERIPRATKRTRAPTVSCTAPGKSEFARKVALVLLLSLLCGHSVSAARIRDYGVVIGELPTGPLNAVTDVEGVRVGHATIREEGELYTGVTVILPHGGNLFQEKVPAAVFVANGFGKLIGSTQVYELGVLETPIALTSTLSVWKVADALAEWVLEQPGNEDVRSINPLVGECNDGYLSNIRRRAVGRQAVRQALEAARPGPVEEGSIGAGTGTTCLGFKGGIGTASRRLPESLGGWTVGVLVQTNFGGSLTVAGVPVGRLLGKLVLDQAFRDSRAEHGSCMMILATDAPLTSRQLRRLATRAPLGLSRVGSSMAHGSGDYAVAFSAHPQVRELSERRKPAAYPRVPDDELSPLFQAVVEATEEAVLNSLFAAETVVGWKGHTAEALPKDKVLSILRRYGVLSEESGAQ